MALAQKYVSLTSTTLCEETYEQLVASKSFGNEKYFRASNTLIKVELNNGKG
jgi:hypothetical protein